MASLASASSEFVDVFRQGLSAYDQDDYEQAYHLFGKALEVEPDNVWGLLWRGATAPTPDEAARWLEQVLEVDPENPHAQAGLAWAREATTVEQPPAEVDEVDEAEIQPDVTPAEPALDLEEEDVSSWLRDEDEGDDVEADVTITAEEEEDVPEWLQEEPAAADTAISGFDEGDVEIVDSTDVAEPVAEDDVPAWLLEEDEEAADTVTAEPPEAVEETGLPAWLVGEEEGEPATAEVPEPETPEGSLKAPNEVVQAFQAGLDAYDQNNLERAQEYFERTLRLDPTHVEAYNYLGSVYFLQGDQQEAINAFEEALTLDDSYAESYLNLGLVYQETNEHDKAVAMFERYLTLDPESAIAEDVRGFIESLQ